MSACTEESSLSLDTETAVVQAYLYAGQPIGSIAITQSFSYARESTDLITLEDLDIEISDGNQSIPLFHSSEGNYQNLDFKPESGKTYTLTFEHNGEQISSETFIPEKKEIAISQTSIELEKIEGTGFPGGGFGQGNNEAIEITWENNSEDYYYVVVENIEEDPEFVNDFLAEFLANGTARRFFRITEPEITDFHALNTRRDLTQFGTYRIIVYRVNPEYAALYESSGSSSVTIAQPPNNIENGLGIFTGISSDTVFLEVIKI
jgi:hypothetical protein